MRSMLALRLGIAAIVTMVGLDAAEATRSGQHDPLPSPLELEVEAQKWSVDFDRMPDEFADLRFDAAVARDIADGDLDYCSELVPLAKERAAEEPRRPGPRQVLQLCAALQGDFDTAESEGARVKELVAASRVPAQAWGTDLYYDAVGISDAMAIVISEAVDDALIAEALDPSWDGHRLFNLVWTREANGRVRRFRIDITRQAERFASYLASKSGDEPDGGDVFLAAPAYYTIIFKSKLPHADSATLTALARIVDRSEYFSKVASVDETLGRAIAQQDVYAMHVQAERILGKDDVDEAERSTARELLHRAAEAGLPESQALLAVECERAGRACERGESKRWALAVTTAHGDAEAKLRRFLALRQVGREREAQRALEQAADAGSARATTVLAMRLERESGDGDDDRAARIARLWEDAARLGDVAAISTLASRDLKRATQPAQRADAISRLRQAAVAGSAGAAYALGEALARGNGVKQDLVEAAHWYRVSAYAGHESAQVAFAAALLAGNGVAANLQEGRMWLWRAMLQGSMPAVVAIAELYLQGTGVPRNAERAASYLHDAARNGHAAAQKRYADLLWDGEGVKEDHRASIEWYEKAAAQDHPPALLRLGWIHETGAGVDVDGTRAYGYYGRCEKLDEGVGDCLNNLALAVWNGMGVPADRPRAIALFRRSLALGSAPASCNLGDVLDAEEATSAEREEGERLIAASAEAGQAHCQYLHALNLLKLDPSRARDAMAWLRKAADAGNADAGVAIVVQMFDDNSRLWDPAAGLAYAEACFAAGNPRCLGKAGMFLMEEQNAGRKVKGREMLQRAALGGDEDSALYLGLLAYGSAGSEAEARRWLVLGGGALAIARLARLDVRSGDPDLARRRLMSVHGNLLAYFQLIEICRVVDCGDQEFSVPGWFAVAGNDGPEHSLRLLNGVAWAVATDVLASRDEARALLEMMQPDRFPLDDDWSYRNSYAGVLARAGDHAEACEQQRVVVATARASTIRAFERAQLELMRDAYCAGRAWDRW